MTDKRCNLTIAFMDKQLDKLGNTLYAIDLAREMANGDEKKINTMAVSISNWKRGVKQISPASQAKVELAVHALTKGK